MKKIIIPLIVLITITLSGCSASTIQSLGQATGSYYASKPSTVPNAYQQYLADVERNNKQLERFQTNLYQQNQMQANLNKQVWGY